MTTNDSAGGLRCSVRVARTGDGKRIWSVTVACESSPEALRAAVELAAQGDARLEVADNLTAALRATDLEAGVEMAYTFADDVATAEPLAGDDEASF